MLLPEFVKSRDGCKTHTFKAAGIVLSCGIHAIDTGFILPCMCVLNSGIFPNNARPIAPKCVGVSSSQIEITIISDVCLSDAVNPMILVYSIMKLQLLITSACNFDIPWLLAAKASGLQTSEMCS